MINLLVVDDDPDMLELLRSNFEEAGYSVATAASGMEALHQARRLTPRAIVLDLLLPDLDGMSICEILRKQPSTASVPVLMLTAMGGQICRLAGLEAGADEFVTKPIRPGELVNRVEALLRKKESAKAGSDAES